MADTYYRDLALVATAALTSALNLVLVIVLLVGVIPPIHQAIETGHKNNERLTENSHLLDEHAARLKRLLDEVDRARRKGAP